MISIFSNVPQFDNILNIHFNEIPLETSHWLNDMFDLRREMSPQNPSPEQWTSSIHV